MSEKRKPTIHEILHCELALEMTQAQIGEKYGVTHQSISKRIHNDRQLYDKLRDTFMIAAAHRLGELHAESIND